MDIHGVFDAISQTDKGTCLAIPDTWLQGRTAFGGLLVAVGLAAMRRVVPTALPLRSLLVAFVGPSGTGSVHAQATILRQGRSVTHVQAQVVTPEGEVCTTLHACFGTSRTSTISHDPSKAPDWPAPENLTELPFMEGLSPRFTQYMRYFWAEGPYPFEGKSHGAYGGWVSYQGEAKKTTEAHLIALMDAWPSPSLSMLTTPAPASSLTWHLELFHTGEGFTTSDSWAFKTQVDKAENGYVSEGAKLWTPDGQLAGISRQDVTVFG